jgi:hypothetical protein
MTSRFMIAMILAAAVGAVTALPMPAGAVSAEEIEKASTPADHEALAAQYQQEASDARAEAAKHLAMAKAYASGVTYAKVQHGGKGAMKLHCERLAEHYDSVAAEADALAAFHSELAAKK